MKQVLMEQEQFSIHQRDALQERLKQLRQNIISKKETFEKGIYQDLCDFYDIKKKLYPSYNFLMLSQDLEMEYTTTCKILSWRHASEKMKQRVASGELTFSRALWILQNSDRSLQDKTAKTIIKHKLSLPQTRAILQKGNITPTKAKMQKAFTQQNHIAVSLINNSLAMQRSLIQVGKMPQTRYREVLKVLLKHRRLVLRAVTILERKVSGR